MSDNPLTDILSGVSAYMTQVIDDRLELKYRSTVLPPAIREEVARMMEGGNVNSIEFATKVEGIMAQQVRATVQAELENISQTIRGMVRDEVAEVVNRVVEKFAPTRKAIADQVQQAIEDADLEGKAEEAVDNWMDDTANVNKLTRELDLHEAVDEVLRGGTFDVSFRR